MRRILITIPVSNVMIHTMMRMWFIYRKKKTRRICLKRKMDTKGRNRGRGRRQYHHGTNGHGHGTQISSHGIEPSKPPPGPKMPDETRGFTMGRGRPLVSTN
ncbi:hypothetical protein PHJA_001188100 [Phtheirospermum japonicum]|uniref:Uncharacterized protein n=1 Tax=Phtheirospermum japonicum TaxID=374723 RepID=A0A830BWT2_9LAMI|nr:hypothetical protein PHJA_001188100 [Phtheirospermum japonicum]